MDRKDDLETFRQSDYPVLVKTFLMVASLALACTLVAQMLRPDAQKYMDGVEARHRAALKNLKKLRIVIASNAKRSLRDDIQFLTEGRLSQIKVEIAKPSETNDEIPRLFITNHGNYWMVSLMETMKIPRNGVEVECATWVHYWGAEVNKHAATDEQAIELLEAAVDKFCRHWKEAN